MFLKHLSLSALVFFSFSANASDVSATHRLYSPNQCSYFSSLLSDFNITYSNLNLDAMDKVTLVYGFKWARGTDVTDWLQTKELVMRRNTSDQFAVLFTEETAYRSSGEAAAIQFVFRIQPSVGEIYYDKGNESIMGHYEADLSKQLECKPAAFYLLTIRSIFK